MGVSFEAWVVKQVHGELIVIHKRGQIATKRLKACPGVGSQIVRFSFPIIRPKSDYSFGKTGVQVEGMKFKNGEMVRIWITLLLRL